METKKPFSCCRYLNSSAYIAFTIMIMLFYSIALHLAYGKNSILYVHRATQCRVAFTHQTWRNLERAH